MPRQGRSAAHTQHPSALGVLAPLQEVVEAAAQGVLDARTAHKGASLADLYELLTMPPNLVKAHQALDKAVDKCYRPQPFGDPGSRTGDAKRVEYLFELYEKYMAGLLAGGAKANGKKKAE